MTLPQGSLSDSLGKLFSSNDLLEALKDNTDYYNFLISWFSEKDYIIAKTSGSTGTPKEIKLKRIILLYLVLLLTNNYYSGKNLTFVAYIHMLLLFSMFL